MRVRKFGLNGCDFSPAEIHQINALVKKIGRVCHGKSAHVAAVALQAIVADLTLLCTDDEAGLHEGVDAFARDVKTLISQSLNRAETAH